MQGTISESVVARIRKLQRLSGSPNEHEAALAAAKMQEMLFAHNLSVETLADPGEFVEVEHELQSRVWARMLLSAVCRNNFCEPLHGKWGGCMFVVGRRENVEAVSAIFAFLVDQVDRACRVELRRHKEESGQPWSSRSWSAAFRLGAVSTIRRRLDEQRQRDVEKLATSPGGCPEPTAIIRQLDQDLAQEVKRRYPVLGTHRDRATLRSVSGFEAGAAAGTRMALRASRRHLN